MGRSLALITPDGFHITEQGAVVDLDPIIEIKPDAHIGVVFKLVIKGAQLGQLIDEGIDLFANTLAFTDNPPCA